MTKQARKYIDNCNNDCYNFSNPKAAAFIGDISDFETARNLIQTAVNTFGKVDILVNNAGVTAHYMIWEFPEEQWDRLIKIHLKGTFNCTRHASGFMMKQRWGRILNVTSNGWLGVYKNCGYGAAKAGIVGLTRNAARDLGSYGVTCNAYRPAAATRLTSSPEARARWKERYEAGIYTKERYEDLANRPPPETVPPLLVYLCSDDAADVNGQIFDINGSKISIYSEPVRMNTINKETGLWTFGELKELVPKVVLKHYVNPAPPNSAPQDI